MKFRNSTPLRRNPRSNHYWNGLLLLVGLSVALSLAACGRRSRPADQNPAPGQQAQLDPGAGAQPGVIDPQDTESDRLGARIIRGASGPGQPFTQEAVLGTGLRGEGGAVEFEGVLWLSTQERKDSDSTYYLAWKEDISGKKVIQSLFRNIKEDRLGGDQGDYAYKSARLDKRSHFWMVPLEEIVGGPLTGMDPDTVYGIELDLKFDDQSSEEQVVRFRVGGELPTVVPAIHRELLQLNPGLAQDLSARSAIFEGLVLERQMLTNPTSRELSLWATASGGSMALRMGVHVPRHFEAGRNGFEPIISANIEAHQKKADLPVIALRIRSAEKVRTEKLSASSYLRVPLAPGETLVLEWMASPANPDLSDPVKRCVFPAPVERVFPWISLEERSWSECLFMNPCLPKAHAHETRRTEAWAFTGFAVQGNWSKSLVLSDRFLSVEDIQAGLESGRAETLVSEALDVGPVETGGAVSPGLPEYSCSGWF